MGTTHIRTIMINTEDVERLATFWCGFLEVERGPTHGDYTWLKEDVPGGVNLAMQRVDAKLGAHTETHLDISVDDLDAAQRRIEDLGGQVTTVNRLPNGFEWRIATDPDGNEFCIFADAH